MAGSRWCGAVRTHDIRLVGVFEISRSLPLADCDSRAIFSIMRHFAQLMTAALFTSHASAEPLAVGAALPKVTQQDQDGKAVDLATANTGFVLVYFYPKADTPGCTKQACSLRDAFADLSKEGVQVLGVSFDKAEAQKAFKDKFTLPYDLIADPEGKIVAAFKVEKMLKGLFSLAKRSCFLIKDGKVVWQDYQAATEQQAADIKRVLAEAK